MTCGFCNQVYKLDESDLLEILADLSRSVEPDA
jgi:hypothetical protein